MTSVTEPAAEHTIDIHTTAGKLADLRKRAEEAQHPVGEAAVDRVHAKGKLTARERILALLDEGSTPWPNTAPPTSGCRTTAPSATAW